MRKIKVRAWDPEARVLRYDFEVDNYTSDEGEFELVAHSIDKNSDWYKMELTEFTGLKDRNHVDIYEGDILDNSEAHESKWLAEVIFRNGAFQLKELQTGDDRIQCCCDHDMSLWKVVGNIFEDKDLLEAKSGTTT